MWPRGYQYPSHAQFRRALQQLLLPKMGIEILIYADERGELPSKLKVRHLYDTYLLADEVLNSNSSLDFGMSEKLVLLFGVT